MNVPNEPTPPGRSSSKRLEQAGASDASISAIHQQLLREKPEPRDGFSPIPIFILFLFSGLIFYGGIYLGTKSGGFSPLAFDLARNYESAKKGGGETKEVDMKALGQRMFAQCASCHQLNGQGLPGTYPPLAGSEWVNGPEERVIRIVSHGLTGPIEVKGTTFSAAQMPAFYGPTSAYRFNERRIAAVLTYVRSSFGNSAPPITEEKVREVLSAVGQRSQPWTAAELQQVQ